MTRFAGIALAATMALGAAFAPASAMPVTWTLHNVIFDDGATASGSYVYDADTNLFSSIAITTTSGAASAGASYTLIDPGFSPNASFFVFVTGPLADYTGTPALALSVLPAMTNAGGIAAVSNGEFACIDAACTNGTPVRLITSGFVTAPSIPEPATLSLLAFGLLGFGLRRRSAKK